MKRKKIMTINTDVLEMRSRSYVVLVHVSMVSLLVVSLLFSSLILFNTE